MHPRNDGDLVTTPDMYLQAHGTNLRLAIGAIVLVTSLPSRRLDAFNHGTNSSLRPRLPHQRPPGTETANGNAHTLPHPNQNTRQSPSFPPTP